MIISPYIRNSPAYNESVHDIWNWVHHILINIQFVFEKVNHIRKCLKYKNNEKAKETK